MQNVQHQKEELKTAVMKKILFTLIVCAISFVSAEAQVTSGGFRRAGTKHATKAMQRDKLKDTLNISEGKSKNVDALQQMYMLRIRAINLDTKLSKEERKSMIKEIQEERREKLRAVLTEEQLAKLDNETPKVEKAKTDKKYSSGKKKNKSKKTKKRQQ
jgi:hypothetical protein